MKKSRLLSTVLCSLFSVICFGYTPTDECLRARQQFRDNRFGIFLHWGLYSMFGQGEWYLNYGPTHEEYAKSAAAFYPANFDAARWVKAFKDAGAKYVTLTSRHHDGFSLWDTEQSPYNVVDATPFGRDIVKELAQECQRQGLILNLYYSLIDWGRDDYPWGRTGRTTGKDPDRADYGHYLQFMKDQITELLTNYGPIGAIWFDGVWDHLPDPDDPVLPDTLDWRLSELYDHIHRLQPSCLVVNNHHSTPFEGEDVQVFERDLPGENTAGYSGQAVSALPLETCQTMNGMWGYKIKDQDYKTTDELIRLIVGAAGKGANLLLNIGPQPSGDLPAAALDRLKGIGEFMEANGETIYGTDAGPFPPQTWGVSTRSRQGNTVYVHVLRPEAPVVYLPMAQEKILSARRYGSAEPLPFQKADGGYVLDLGQTPGDTPDFIVELTTDHPVRQR